MRYMTSKTRSVFTRLFGGSDQKLKRVSSERASHHPAAFQVLGTSCSSQDNFQTNYMFLSHTSGRFHWVSLKPVVCWQEFLWAHPLNSFSFRGMFFFPLWQCELSSSLNSDWAHSFRPVSNISDHRCSLHFEFLLLPTCCSYLFFFFFWNMQAGLNTHRFRAVSSEIQVWIVQVWMVPPFKISFQQGFKNRNTDTWFASVIWVCTFCGTYISVSFGGVCIYCKKKLNFVYKNSISWCGSLWELVFLIGQLLMLCFPKKFQFTSGRLKSELAFLH